MRVWGMTAAALVLLAGAGCGARTEYVLDELAVERRGWDSLAVDVAFLERPGFRAARPVEPARLQVHLFDADYDTLYAGAGPVVPVPDAALGDAERLMLEVCGTFAGRPICEQHGLRASAKRLSLQQDITFPEDADYRQGSYDLRFEVERARFEGDGWERIDRGAAVHGYLLASVEGVPGTRPVRVPFRGHRGRFDLARHDNYDDFRFAVDSQLMDEREARVRFEVFAGLGGEAVPVATVETRLEAKSAADRAAEVSLFVEQAVGHVVEALQSFFGGRGATAYVEDWTWDRLRERYRVELELHWRGAFYDDGRYRLEGVLEVGDDGRDATFRATDGNYRARRRWERRIDGDLLRLPDLDVPADLPDDDGWHQDDAWPRDDARRTDDRRRSRSSTLE